MSSVFFLFAVQKRAAARHDLKLRTYKYVKEYRLQREELIKNKREARAKGEIYSSVTVNDL